MIVYVDNANGRRNESALIDFSDLLETLQKIRERYGKEEKKTEKEESLDELVLEYFSSCDEWFSLQELSNDFCEELDKIKKIVQKLFNDGRVVVRKNETGTLAYRYYK